MNLDTEVDDQKELNKFRAQELKELSAAIGGATKEKRAKIKKEEVNLMFLNTLANQRLDYKIQM